YRRQDVSRRSRRAPVTAVPEAQGGRCVCSSVGLTLARETVNASKARSGADRTRPPGRDDGTRTLRPFSSSSNLVHDAQIETRLRSRFSDRRHTPPRRAAVAPWPLESEAARGRVAQGRGTQHRTAEVVQP